MTSRLAALVLFSLAAAACSDGSTPPTGTNRLNVFAAASLTEAFSEIAGRFEAANPDVDVVVNFAGSSTLRAQILEGAPADVFASANVENMDRLVDAGAASEPQVFATGSMVIAVPAGNPGDVGGLGDFARTELFIGMCAEQVPCGDAGRAVLGAAGVDVSLDTAEPDVRSLLTKIEEGELDAGIVYESDIAGRTDTVETVPIPDGFNVTVAYPIAVLGTHPAAETFVQFVLSATGQAVLRSYGFESP